MLALVCISYTSQSSSGRVVLQSMRRLSFYVTWRDLPRTDFCGSGQFSLINVSWKILSCSFSLSNSLLLSTPHRLQCLVAAKTRNAEVISPILPYIIPEYGKRTQIFACFLQWMCGGWTQYFFYNFYGIYIIFARNCFAKVPLIERQKRVRKNMNAFKLPLWHVILR